jgi:hypothetical protein
LLGADMDLGNNLGQNLTLFSGSGSSKFLAEQQQAHAHICAMSDVHNLK